MIYFPVSFSVSLSLSLPLVRPRPSTGPSHFHLFFDGGVPLAGKHMKARGKRSLEDDLSIPVDVVPAKIIVDMPLLSQTGCNNWCVSYVPISWAPQL